jgi:hypothetical protein
MRSPEPVFGSRSGDDGAGDDGASEEEASGEGAFSDTSGG